MKIRKSALAISRSMRIGIAAITSTALVAGTLVAVPAHPLLPVTAVAQAQEAPFATAEGQVIDLSLFTDSVDPADREAFLTVLEAIRAEAQYPGNESNDANVDLTLLEGIDVTISGVSIPLTDLLNIQGPAGVLGATASTPAGNQAYAAAGVLTDDGSIDLSATSGPGGVETVLDLSDILAPQLTDGIIDELSLRVGAVSASAERNGDQVTSEYALTNADLVLDSPLVASVTDLLISEDPAAPGVGTQVDSLVSGVAGEAGLVNGILGALGPVVNAANALPLGLVSLGDPTITLDSNIQETLELLLGGPLTSSSGAVTLNLETGEVIIDLEALGGTSAVDPNTDLLTEAAVAQISAEINEILTDLVAEVRTAVRDGLLETAVTIDVDLRLLAPIASITIDGTLNQILNGDDVSSLTLLGAVDLPGVGAVLQNVLGAVGDVLRLALNDVADGVVDTLLDDVLADVAAPLIGNLSTILNDRNLLRITLNDQPNPQIVSEITRDNSARPNEAVAPITNPDEAFTVSALRINILNGVVDLPVARATVNADADWVVAPTLDEIADQTVTLGDAIAPVTPATTPATATVAVAGLPTGVTYNNTTNTISGTPAAVGTYEVTATATTTGGTATQTFTINVENPAVAPTIGDIDDQAGVVDEPITPIDVEVTPDNATVTVVGLPAGVTYNNTTGTITGTPTIVGTFNVTVAATNDAGTDTEQFTLTVTDPDEEPGVVAPTIGNIDDQTGTVGTPIEPVEVEVTPDTAEVTVEGLPAGVTYNEDTGEITGTPTEAGTTTVTVTAVNDGRTVTETFLFTVEEQVDAPNLGDIDDVDGTTNIPITPITVVVTPGDTTIVVEGLPDGVDYNEDTGIISGTPTESGTFTVTVTATNSAGSDEITFNMNISDGTGNGGGSIDNGSVGNGSSDNGNGGADNGSSAFLQQCLDSPAAGLVGLLAALGAVSAIAGPALEPLLKSIGSAVDQQLRDLTAATSGAHQPAWVQTINRGLNDAANAVNHQMVSNALFATAALALVSSPILCDTDGPGSSAGSSIGSS